MGRKTSQTMFNPVPGIGQYIDYATTLKQHPPEAYFEYFLAQIPQATAISFFSDISLRLYHANDNRLDFERDFVRACRGESAVADSIALNIERQLGPGYAFMSPEQLAVLNKLSIMYCPESSAKIPINIRELTLRLMLMYNSYRGREGIQGSSSKDQMLAIELRGAFNSASVDKVIIHLYDSFFAWAQTSDSSKRDDFCDINADFKRFTDFSYEDYCAAAMCFISFYLSVQKSLETPGWTSLQSLKKYLSQAAESERIKKWFWMHAISLDDAKKEFSTGSNAFYAGASLECFRERPILVVEDDKFFCPHLPFLMNKVGHALYYILWDGYAQIDGDQQKANKLSRMFGCFFERYCFRMMEENHSDAATVFPEVLYGKNMGKKSSDIAIFEGANAVFVDATVSSLTHDRTVIDLDRIAIEEEIKGKFVKKARQISNVIDDFRRGEVAFLSLDDPGKIAKIYPIALLLKGIPRVWGVNSIIYEAIMSKGYLSNAELFDIWDIEDFQIVVQIGRSNIPLTEILEKKCAHPSEYARKMGLREYLFYFDPALLKRINQEPQFDYLSEWWAKIQGIAVNWLGA